MGEVNNRISSLKGSPEPLITSTLRGGFGVLPKGLTNVVWPAMSNKVSLSVSSLPGPSFDFEWGGTPIKNVAFWVPPVGSVSLFVTIITFRNQISVALSADSSTVVGIHLSDLATSIVKEVDRFIDSGGNPSQPRSKL